MMNTNSENNIPEGIAIVGIAGRFPGAANIYEFWDIIKQGKETITYYTKEELINKGVDSKLLENNSFVYANGIIDSGDKFDASFFGFTPREADFMDPQHRVFLEVCYEALEHSGYYSEGYEGSIGVFGGSGPDNYILKNLIQHPEMLRSLGEFQTIINNGKDFLTTHVSYKLNLTGPSFTIQTACSTSLVAVHTACQSLLNYQCDMALAGGVFIHTPRGEGYMYEPGGIFSPEGHCRPFDIKANGTLFGEGAGVVVLKRVEDAVNDGDTIWAVIRGSAINNDGSVKVGYMAPSVEGQAKVVSMAQAFAEVSPDMISYIEAHGTGTNMGDPIEVSALTQVFRSSTDEKNICALGSVKGNIGHLDAAAGVAGLIKTVMALRNRQLPPSINYQTPNPGLHLESSPFYINTELKEWKSDGPRIAGISAFGIGGTNAHCIVEEVPEFISEESSRKLHLLPVTAKTAKALSEYRNKLLLHLKETGEKLSDIAYTLQHGRKHLKYRNLLVCNSIEDAVSQLESGKSPFLFEGTQTLDDADIVFMYTGQGSQYVTMAKGLYDEFDSFRKIVDKAHAVLYAQYNIDLLNLLYGSDPESASEKINNTSVAQPLLFVIQYAVSKLMEEFGIKPVALIGHSIGELTAACISGVFSFEDTLHIVANRGILMQNQKPGAMLSVKLPAEKVIPMLNEKINLALKNAPDFCVVSGDFADIDDFEDTIKKNYPDIFTSRLVTSHAFHSYLMEPAIEPFKKVFENIKAGDIKIPFISNITGTWITKEQAGSADYWAKHIRSTVNFVDGINEILKNENTYFFEIGPGTSLATLLKQYSDGKRKINVISTVRHPKQQLDDKAFFFKSIAQAWIEGVNIEWGKLYEGEKRLRVPIPTYPFERKRHWVEPKKTFSYHVEYSTGRSSDISGTDKDILSDIHDDSGSFSHSRPNLESQYEAPVLESDKKIVKIWEDLLGIKGIGISDDFFALGGHSLLAAQVTTRINDEFKVNLPLEILFEKPTIKSLNIEPSTEKTEGSQNEIIERIAEAENLPVSFNQKRLWVITQLNRENPEYNIPFTYRLTGTLNTDIFHKSINMLFNRHGILQSSIKPNNGQPVCVIQRKEIIPIEYLDYSYVIEDKQEEVIQKLVGDDVRKAYDIENGPLYRIYLIKINERQHIFHVNFHHLIFDGWSWGVLAAELKQIYNNLFSGQEISLEEVPLQYYEYAAWMEKNEDESKYQKSIDYWKKQLENVPNELKFPYDFPRKNKPSGRGGREAFNISSELMGKLKKLCKEEGVTLYMVLVSAFALLLKRYSNEDDICIGSPVANRSRKIFEKVIGFFVNTLVLRFRFDSTPNFRSFVNQTKKTLLEALAHQDLSFDKIVDILKPGRIFNIHPLFQVSFAYQSTPRPPLDFENIVPERIMPEECVSPFDITMYMWEEDNILEGEIEFNTDILLRDTIVRFKNNFIVLLENLVAYADSPVSSIPLISEQEKDFLMKINNTRSPYPANKTIVQVFEEQVVKNPGKKAISYNNKYLSYKELDMITDKLAVLLREKGIKRKEPVGIMVNKSLEMIIGILGILKAGGAYLPIDPDYPDERVSYMLQEGGCKILLVHEKLKNRAGIEKGVEIININDKQISRIPHSKVYNVNKSTDLAYIMFTSGSTGKSKGLMVNHKGIIRLVINPNYINLTPADKILLTGAIVFDATTFEIWGALLNGGTLYLCDKEVLLDPKKLGQEIAENKITILWLTSSLFTQMAEQRTDIFAPLKYLLVGGDVISPKHINKVRNEHPHLQVINGYGPTENTTFSTCFPIHKDYNASIPIGYPISNSTAYIVDRYDNLQPIGTPGELWVGGDGIADGYLNHSELTAQKFIINPLNKNEYIFRTGDLARWLPDGSIEFLGRIDNQIKIRGFRVEPEEIESMLNSITGVKETVVKLFKISDPDSRLIAFLNTNDEFNYTIDQVVDILKEKLPSYMIPSDFVLMDDFPRTINGKIDKRALHYDIDKLTKVKNQNEPLSPVEQKVFDIWNEKLNFGNFSKTDNFFDIGGHSLLAISVVSKISSVFDISLDVKDFFDRPTVKDISEWIELKTSAKENIIQTKPKQNIAKGEI